MFYLFEEEVSREVLGEKWRPAAFVGYFTVFGFRNPVKGVSLRVCQALLLPQYQRQGESVGRSRASSFLDEMRGSVAHAEGSSFVVR